MYAGTKVVIEKFDVYKKDIQSNKKSKVGCEISLFQQIIKLY